MPVDWIQQQITWGSSERNTSSANDWPRQNSCEVHSQRESDHGHLQLSFQPTPRCPDTIPPESPVLRDTSRCPRPMIQGFMQMHPSLRSEKQAFGGGYGLRKVAASYGGSNRCVAEHILRPKPRPKLTDATHQLSRRKLACTIRCAPGGSIVLQCSLRPPPCLAPASIPMGGKQSVTKGPYNEFAFEVPCVSRRVKLQ